MDEITKDNVLALLEECLVNGENGSGSLWAWFCSEKDLIQETLWDIGIEDGGEAI